MAERPKKRRKLGTEVDDHPPGHVLQNHYGNITVEGKARAQLGDIHHHHYSHTGSNVDSKTDVNVFKELRESLLFDRWEDRIRNVTKPLPRTCDWLFEHDHFKSWTNPRMLDEHHGFLWIKGHPGCGKSTIMKHAVEWIRKKRKKDWTVISYFFNGRAKDELEKSSLGLYRSLAYQLLIAFPTTMQLFIEHFASKAQNHIRSPWDSSELQNFIVDAVQNIQGPLCILVDALDEGQEADIRLMISFLEDLASYVRQSNSTLRIWLSSRHYPHISITHGLSLEVERQSAHDADIALYVEAKLKVYEPEHMSALCKAVNTKSAGIFLWVVLVIEILNQVYDRGEGSNAMTNCLRKLPETLEGVFTDILCRSNVDVRTCISLLRWVLYCSQPLSPSELYSAVQHSNAVSPGDNCEQLKIGDARTMSKYILNHSRGLVEVTASNPPTAQFIHETVREFLLHTRRTGHLEEFLTYMEPGLSHEALKVSCLRCISCTTEHAGDAGSTTLPEKANAGCPLVAYSTASLLKHAEAAQANAISQVDFCLRMLVPTDVHWRKYLCCRNRYEKYKLRRYNMHVGLLYVAAEQNRSRLVNVMASFLVDVNKTGGRYGNALQAACHHGHKEIVECLISNGANVNANGGEHKHAVVAAVLSKNYAIAELLINKGAKAEGAKAEGAILKKHLATVCLRSVRGAKVLLQLCARLLSNQDELSHPTFKAIRCDTFLARYILKAGRTIDLSAEQVSVSTEAVTRNGDEPVIRMVLDAGADVRQMSFTCGDRLIIAAAATRYQQIVQTLIDAGVDLDQEDPTYGTALYIACRGGYLRIVQMLLDAGAEVLLDAGAEINQEAGFYGTALQAASARYHVEVMTLLLARGGDINLQGGVYGSALNAAIHFGHQNAVKLLLERGADVLLEGSDGRCALDKAAQEKSLEILRLLVAETVKADVDKSHLRRVLERAVKATEVRTWDQDKLKLLTDRLSALDSS
ncbi:hypothetical protein LTR24_010706 [Lithohypha guttulata]|uniref:Nephrocystin 3-like N-terminal domain-containing protein n=1 Tax=Lithohypha guttulata TaxID=1690604 RepID=A0ABR0JTC5_9EURO|nr:hypothetical protein LTR24_010706 [Lithohypha guttulata]